MFVIKFRSINYPCDCTYHFNQPSSEESECVALNLKLSDDVKRIWFGNMTLGYDAFANENRYHVKGNLMNFGKK